MPIAPTKSNLLVLKRQLAFAQEGFDLLEQKRQLLIFELMKRLVQARQIEQTVSEALAAAHSMLTQAELASGSRAIDAAILGCSLNHTLELSSRRFLGLQIPHVQFTADGLTPQFGPIGTSAHADEATRRFFELLPLLAKLAEAQTTIMRLARELRKTQRRCNALSRIFIPRHRKEIHYIQEHLEEREREEFIILKMIRNRRRIN